MVSSLASKIARQVKKKGEKDLALEVSGLMARSRRLLSEAKQQYKEASKLPTNERDKRQQEALARAREAKQLAAEAKRLMGKE
ncbi:MAG: hypothetical protein ACE5GS_16075 [Kiloniellaceae bacterium]